MSNTLALKVRQARQEDAAEIARVYLESWLDIYPGILPPALLRAMTIKKQTMRWQDIIGTPGKEVVLAAETPRYGIVGMASLGPSRDGGLDFDGEIYALYVDPSFYGQGAGRALLNGTFGAMRRNGMSSCVIWAHARGPARFFYEAMGGRLIAERCVKLMDQTIPEAAFGWKSLALAERSPAR